MKLSFWERRIFCQRRPHRRAPLAQLDYQDELEQARRIFPTVEVGYDGMEIDFQG